MKLRLFPFLAKEMAKKTKTNFEIAVINKVRAKRLEKGFSQEDIASLLDLSRGFIGQIESPDSPSKYNLSHLNQLALEMDCSVKDFIPDKPIPEGRAAKKRKSKS